ncbi:hypothetical protein [Polyangium fumosum]|uniref:EGF-like domain-containing protein n=1 Tax=Polyangium fumosum TaxID=889272 RepID=A0A4U1J7C1_9BACT|nr:hypothetical protein [Polyangium fumosum]TKD03065.1 hypothetical protein E8A74_27440 [Polyangium fumosum]
MQKTLAGLLGALVFGSFAACNDSYVSGWSEKDAQGGSEPSIVASPETGEGGAGGGEAGGEGESDAGALSCVTDGFCHESSGGNCPCSGTCNGKAARVSCGWSTGQAACTCFVDGVEVGKCSHEPGAYQCGLATTCCNQFFL